MLLIRELLRVVVKEKSKFINYADWPTSQFYIAQTLTILGFNVGTLRAGMTREQKSSVVATFNNPHDHTYDVLIASSRSASQSLNLQTACHNILIWDTLPVNQMLQIAGRIHRLGQKKKQHVFCFCADRTFEQHLWAVNSERQVAQIVATMEKIPLAEEQFETMKKKSRDAIEKMAAKNIGPEDFRGAAQLLWDQMRAQKILTRMLGLRSSRNNEE